jgi:PAS domain S-box-containing protein
MAEELQRASSLYARSLIEASLDPLVTISPDGKITDVNEASVQATGVVREKLIGADFSDYFTEPTKAREGYQQGFSQGYVRDYPLTIRHVNGKVTDVLYNARVYNDDKGKVLGVFAAARDVTEHKRAEEEIKKLNEDLGHRAMELDAINKELETFSYSVAHDLRAPLRGIDGFSQVLLEDCSDRLDEKGKDNLRRVRAASQRMGQLIDALLNLSRLTRGKVYRESVDLSAGAKMIAAELQRREPERRVEFLITEGVTVNGDPQMMQAVLENLLGNAWKFTGKHPTARIEFGVTQDEGKIGYYVRDDGAGFDMAYADKLFGAFQRLHTITEYPGIGIGLATVHRIIHRHGGRLRAEGAIEQGATFYFTLD